MKAFLLAASTSVIVTGAFAQGEVTFATRLTLGFPPYYTQVFMPDDDAVQKTGNTALNLPAGTQTYTGAPLTGSGWTAQLWSLPGSTLPVGPFTAYGVPVSDAFVGAVPTTTFRTGVSAGSVANTTATLGNVALGAASAVLQMRVFPTSYGSWPSAVAAYDLGDPLALIGASPAFVVNLIGGNGNPPPQLTSVSFSLVVIPEPTSFALAGLGIATLVILRSRPKRLTR